MHPYNQRHTHTVVLLLLLLLLQVLTLIVAAAPSFDERAISNCLHGLAALELSQEREVIAALLGQAESTGDNQQQ
jgi:hypothetical protein